MMSCNPCRWGRTFRTRPAGQGRKGGDSMPQHMYTTATASAHATSATHATCAAPSSGQPIERWPMSLVRYPDPAIQVLDPRFAPYRLGNAAVERLASGFRWAEGPIWFGDGRYLLWSDIPNNRIMR